MSLTAQEKLKLKRLIKELRSQKALHTEFVTVFIPAGYEITKIIQHLAEEQGTASNIKSASTRKNVQSALEKMIQHLRLFKKTPENGLAVFSGNVASTEGKQDMKVWSIEPPIPLNTRIYRCDKHFVTDLLEEMMVEHQVYGLVVLDRRDATIALLKGKTIVPLQKTHSEVPGKIKAGGQCCVPATLIQSCDGEILQIKNSHNPYVLASMAMDNFSLTDSPITDKWDVTKSQVHKIVTKYPRLEVQTSKDHVFFVYTNDGIQEKSAEELKEGDFLIMPEVIDVKGKVQLLQSEKYKTSRTKAINLPKEIDQEFAQFLGYFVGDGSIETDRITLFEQDKDVALHYKEKYDKYFEINSSYRFRERKNYHQLRFTSRPLVRLIREEFPAIKKARDTLIPDKILKSPNNILAAFIRGFFDAEGYVSVRKQVAFGINNKLLAQQIQMALLRFSIISSLHEYDNRRNPYSNNHRFTIDITEKQSLELFRKFIGFSCQKKSAKLDFAIENKTTKSNVRQLIVPGSEIRKIIEGAGYNIQAFPKTTNFFRNERMMSKEVFKNSILSYAKDQKLHDQLEPIVHYPFLPVKIKSIEITEEATAMVDISVKNQNFIANGVIVHNSAQRFARIREGAYKDHFKKIAEYMKNQFLPLGNDLKGIILGGPGTTVNEFLQKDYLTGDIKKKIIGHKDLSYTGEFGLQELLDKSSDLLAEEEIAREKKIMQEFFDLLNKKPRKVTYGEKETIKALDMNAVDKLLLSESLEEDTIIDLEEKAEKGGAKVIIISTETREGVQLKDLGKIAAMLRFELE